MRKIYKVIIVGGGASGLMCAMELFRGDSALSPGEVLVLERGDRVGRKLLATGNGQGNVSNENISEENYYGAPAFIENFVRIAVKRNLPEYLYRLGIPTCREKDGKIYPLSKKASSLVDFFRFYLEGKAEFLFDSIVTEIKAKDGIFEIKGAKGSFFCEKVVVAAGGSSGNQFGTDGSAYSLLTSFGHAKTPVYPALVKIKTETYPIRGLKGLKESARVTATDGEKPIKTALGDVIFTDYGVSGSAAYQVSGHFHTAKNPMLKIEFLPELGYAELVRILSDRMKNAPFMTGENLLNGIINKKIGYCAVINADKTSPESIAESLKNFKLKVKGTLGFSEAQVTKGGISTDKIRPETFESEFIRGLYAVGEILNVDGDCGGYNLTFAFTSAILAAEDIKNKFRN